MYRKNCGYGNCNHRYNVSHIHLHELLGGGNFGEFYERGVRVCADRL
jgi:hypothetical protein